MEQVKTQDIKRIDSFAAALADGTKEIQKQHKDILHFVD
jgi:hypothetical protein